MLQWRNATNKGADTTIHLLSPRFFDTQMLNQGQKSTQLLRSRSLLLFPPRLIEVFSINARIRNVFIRFPAF